MQLTVLLIILGITGVIGVMGGLAILQAKRFHYLNKRTRWITWSYAGIFTLLAALTLISFLEIDF